MIETRGNARFALEAIAPLRRTGLIRRQDFDRDIAVERQFMRQINGAHSAATKQSLDPILKPDGFFERLFKRINIRIRSRLHAPTALRAEFCRRRQHCSAFTTFHNKAIVIPLPASPAARSDKKRNGMHALPVLPMSKSQSRRLGNWYPHWLVSRFIGILKFANGPDGHSKL